MGPDFRFIYFRFGFGYQGVDHFSDCDWNYNDPSVCVAYFLHHQIEHQVVASAGVTMVGWSVSGTWEFQSTEMD